MRAPSRAVVSMKEAAAPAKPAPPPPKAGPLAFYTNGKDIAASPDATGNMKGGSMLSQIWQEGFKRLDGDNYVRQLVSIRRPLDCRLALFPRP